MRAFTASLATETNTFAPMPTGLASFHQDGYFPAGTYPAAPSLFAGPLWAARQRAREHGWQLIEGLVASAQPSGITTRLAYETLRDELLADLRAAMPVDMVLLGLHGAMVADGYDDCEGDLLARVRRIVGPTVVVGAELDPHNHLSAAMVAHADLLISFKHYPHTDVLERAFELVDLCAAQVAGRSLPVASVVDCGMVAVLHTTREPALGFVGRLQAMEGQGGVLSISVTHGFPWGLSFGTAAAAYTMAASIWSTPTPSRPVLPRRARQATRWRCAWGPSWWPCARRWRHPGWTSMPHSTRRCSPSLAWWSSPTAPTTRAVAQRAIRPFCCAGWSSVASAPQRSARCGTPAPCASRWMPAWVPD